MIKVSDYIASFLIANKITDIFTVVGGGAMHLNNSFGHNPKLKCVYFHHEQSCSMAAEGFAKMSGNVAAVCVTSGPGAVNALNGVVGAYQDSTPMLIFSGQVKTNLTVGNSGLNLRTLGGQEFDIVSSISNMTKYSEMITDPTRIRYCLEKALFLATHGRPGPCWIDIPLDVQGSVVDETKLIGFEKQTDVEQSNNEIIVDRVVVALKKAKRPILYAGNGIRISGGIATFRNLINQIHIPVVTCWDSIDLIETDNECYVGRGGTMGDRAGNFAVQNSDLVLAIGNRLSIYQVGYNVSTWAREAFVIDVDIDENELKKPTIRVDLPICMDAKVFLEKLVFKTSGMVFSFADWNKWCEKRKQKYPVVLEKHYKQKDSVNVYAFIDVLSRKANSIPTIVTNGSASVVGSQSYYIANNQRFIMNCAFSSMGYGLPASIGGCIANNKCKVICIEGDGSIQMNIQELQTVVTNNLPIKIFIINNEGYHQIRITQNNIFNDGLVGVGPESGDLGFPDYKKIADAYGLPYFRVNDNSELNQIIDDVLKTDSYCICEVMCSTDQMFEPKSATKKLEDGTLFSPPLEDLAPFLPREELKENMIIEMVEEKNGNN